MTDARNAVVRRIGRVSRRLNPTVLFVIGFVALAAVTTVLVARSRSQAPANYREGEIVTSSVVAPTDIQIEDETATARAREQNPNAPPALIQLRRNQIVARVGEPVTPKMLAEFEAIKRYSRRERLPQHFVGLFFLVAAL